LWSEDKECGVDHDHLIFLTQIQFQKRSIERVYEKEMFTPRFAPGEAHYLTLLPLCGTRMASPLYG